VPSLSKLIDLLTIERARAYAVLTMLLVCMIVLADFGRHPENLTANVDFPAFYNAGRILDSHPWSNLYDRDLQERLYIELVPGVPVGDSRVLYFPYSPFFALIFAPLAFLPYRLALLSWSIISLVLFVIGFLRVWNTCDFQSRYKISALLIALSFLPFYAWCLLVGQSSAFGFFALAISISFDRTGKPFASGLALSLLLYKPPLLVLFLPMLLVTRRWQTLAGFSLGAVILGALSLLMIGSSGLPSYLRMLQSFSVLKITGRRRTFHEIDLFSFFNSIFHDHVFLSITVTSAICVVVFVVLVKQWRRVPARGWALAIPWTTILNLYFLTYDATILILSLLLTFEWLRNRRALRWLVLGLFVTALFDIARLSFQPFTFAIAAFGAYQLWVSKSESAALSVEPT
jgi:glycosyl transferase family 87